MKPVLLMACLALGAWAARAQVPDPFSQDLPSNQSIQANFSYARSGELTAFVSVWGACARPASTKCPRGRA